MKHKRTKQKYQQILTHERLEYKMHRTKKIRYYSKIVGLLLTLLVQIKFPEMHSTKASIG